jgi:hypothetical protein
VHKVRTWNAWTPANLQNDSWFLIGINKDSDPAYERCAFIYFANRLRGLLSNCGSHFIRFLPVAKLTGTTAKITIPESYSGNAYEWFGASFWTGATPCRNVCRDFAPNALPDILHDMKPPVVTMSQAQLNAWEVSTTTTFPFPFTVSDQDSGIDTWMVQRRSLESLPNAWSDFISGSGSGQHIPELISTGGRLYYRVVAIDKQGNKTIGPPRVVFEATDVDALTGPGSFFPAGAPISDPEAFGGGYVPLDDPGDSYEWTYVYPNDGFSREIRFIGPGDGTWSVELIVNGVSADVISADEVADGQRQTIFARGTFSSDMTFRVELISGSGFGIDAVLV